MDKLTFPDIFDGNVKAFFTKKPLCVDIEDIGSIMSIKKKDIYLPIQKHTDTVLLLKSDIEPKIADAVITNKKGLLIGVQVADCVPILLYDKKTSVIGAVHAGWRGTATQIIKKTVQSMVEHFDSSPYDILIALGPGIRWSCYYVGQDVKDAVCNATGDGEYYLQRNGGYCVDLPSANMYQALSMGIPEENIWLSNECTYCNPEVYHSYRYTKSYTGSQGGFIGIF
ncbi:MAG: peptidoglycan editing factor PgeF [Nitrospira sp.]|nr:peptidoglycan editing factor PgeF [Nitrospira sp.]